MRKRATTAPVDDTAAELLTDVRLLKRAIALSGLSDRAFATNVMSRDERTIRYWKSGEVGIPPRARAWLVGYIDAFREEPPAT